MFHGFKIRLSFLVFALLLSLACSVKSDSVIKGKTCEVNFSTFKGLPTEVLFGTNIVDISSFKNSLPALKNEYAAEMGGAELAIYVTQKGNGITFKRTFQEPGGPVDVREYSPVCIVDYRLSAANLKGKFVKDGLLILEEKPNIDGIPDNLWIFYKSK